MENNFDRAFLAPFDNVPVGTIVAWAGPAHTIPQGWLICNGEPVGNQFPELCNVLRDYWGPINDNGHTHTLPDLRGVFLRGVNGTREDAFADPDKATRTSSIAVANEVGSFQADAFQGHWHDKSWSNGPGSHGREPNNTEDGDDHNGFYTTELSITNPITDNVNGAPRVSAETRSKNAYVHYIIKARRI